MVKKFKTLSENQLAQTVKDSAQQIWLAGLGAFAKAQEEGNKVFDALVKEGETIQKKTRKAADEKIAVVAGKAVGTWDRLEQVFEDRVAKALGSLGVPTKKDIDKLSKDAGFEAGFERVRENKIDRAREEIFRGEDRISISALDLADRVADLAGELLLEREEVRSDLA